MYTVRSAHLDDIEAMAKIHVDTWHSTYRGLIPQPFIDSLSFEVRAQMWKKVLTAPASRHHQLVILDEGGELVGFSSGGPSRNEGFDFEAELYAIYLRSDWQGRGLGRILFEASVAKFIEEGFQNLILWVLESNPSVGFYEKMGGQVVGEKLEDFDGLKLKELAMGWGGLRKRD